MDEVDYSTPTSTSSESNSSEPEKKSTQALMQSAKSRIQTAESPAISDQALTTLQSVQDLAQVVTSVLSEKTPKVIL
jgi:hypothetical protein